MANTTAFRMVRDFEPMEVAKALAASFAPRDQPKNKPPNKKIYKI